MTTTSWPLARRSLLKGLGVGAACLPLLRAPRAQGQAGPQRRLLLIEMTEGLSPTAWRPTTGALAAQTLPFSSAAFDDVKGEMIFLPELTNPGVAIAGPGAFGVMFYGLGALGGGPYKEPAGKTLDQVVAAALPPAPGGRPSLCLGVQLQLPPQATTAPGGRYCYWAGAGQPIKPVGDPIAVYADLFAGAADGAAVRRLMARRKSILDYVGANLQDFRGRAGTDDRNLIDAHLQAIRDLEGRLQALPGACTPTPPAMLDVADPAQYPQILAAHLALIVAAFKCGITNVASLQLSDALGAGIDFSFVPGVPVVSQGNGPPRLSWRDVARNPILEGIDRKRLIERWFFDRFAAVFAELRGWPEDDGTMLDHTIAVVGNCMQEGGTASAPHLPWMLAGNAGRRLAAGTCLDSAGHSIGSVMAGVCEALGIASHPYGAPLPGLLR